MATRSQAPVVTDEEFRTALRQVATPVGIVTARAGKARAGVTLTAISSVTAAPPVLLVCVNRDAEVARLIARSGAFAVSFLTQDQYRFAHLFAPAGQVATGFAEGSWTSMTTGSPVLEGCVAGFDCELENTVSTGSHDVHFGRIVGVTSQMQDVLLYHDGMLRRLRSQE